MIIHVSQWVRTLLGLVILGNVVDWALPDSGVRRYAGLVVGLVLLVALVGPLWTLMRQAGSAPNPKTWWGGGSPAHVHEMLARQRRNDVEAIVGALPGVDKVDVQAHASGVLVRVRVHRRRLRSDVKQAAEAAVEEVMGIPPARIRVQVEGGT